MFHPNELAYLALTQKVEHAIRDRLAFSLYSAWAERESLLVCREWKRIDIAILKDSLPLALLEAKAQYTFDILRSGVPHNYPKLILNDVEKVFPRRTADTEVFTLLLATHPHGVPDKQYHAAIKYCPGIIRGSSIDAGLVEARDEVKRRLVGHPMVDDGEITGGSAFGIAVTVAYWLFGPYPIGQS
jgi:hypothetical protein